MLRLKSDGSASVSLGEGVKFSTDEDQVHHIPHVDDDQVRTSQPGGADEENEAGGKKSMPSPGSFRISSNIDDAALYPEPHAGTSERPTARGTKLSDFWTANPFSAPHPTDGVSRLTGSVVRRSSERIEFQKKCCTITFGNTECCNSPNCRVCKLRVIPCCDWFGHCLSKLPCFDESDDGVPPFCRDSRCPLDHRNPYLNDSDCCARWGNVGWKYFDRHRKFYMGIATIVTLLSIFITVAGAFSLSTNHFIVERTYWASAIAINKSTGAEIESVYIGLNTVVQDVCVKSVGDECLEREMHSLDLGFFLSPTTKEDCQMQAEAIGGTNAAYAFCDHCRGELGVEGGWVEGGVDENGVEGGMRCGRPFALDHAWTTQATRGCQPPLRQPSLSNPLPFHPRLRCRPPVRCLSELRVPRFRPARYHEPHAVQRGRARAEAAGLRDRHVGCWLAHVLARRLRPDVFWRYRAHERPRVEDDLRHRAWPGDYALRRLRVRRRGALLSPCTPRTRTHPPTTELPAQHTRHAHTHNHEHRFRTPSYAFDTCTHGRDNNCKILY